MFLSFRKINYNFVRILAFIVLKICFRFEIYGYKNILLVKNPFILASNHQSYLDPIILGATVSQTLNFMARDSLFKNPVFGSFISSLGALPVNLKTPGTGLIKKFYKLLKSGKNLVMFPEGTRSAQDIINDAQPGIGYLISRTEVPVLPVFIKDSAKALPKHAKWIRFCKVKIIIGKLITFKDLENKFKNIKNRKIKYKLYGAYIMHQIERLADERSNII